MDGPRGFRDAVSFRSTRRVTGGALLVGMLLGVCATVLSLSTSNVVVAAGTTATTGLFRGATTTEPLGTTATEPLGVADVEPPRATVTDPIAGAVLSGVSSTVSGTATDNMVVDRVEVSVDGGVSWAPAPITSGAGTGSVTWTYTWRLPAEDADIDHVVMARATDGVGNIGPSVDDPTVRVDTLAPTVTTFVIGTDGLYTATASVRLTVAVADGSPPVEMRLSNDGTFSDAWEWFAPSVPWTLAPGDGTKTVFAEFRDARGNLTTATISDSVIVDTSAPAVIGGVPADGEVDVSISVSPQIMFSDDMDPTTVGSPATSVELRVDSNLSGVLDGGDALVPGVVAYDPAARSAVFTPTAYLEPGTRYFTRVLVEARNASGLSPAEASVSSFVTSDAVDDQGPAVVLVDPEDGATDVPVTTDVMLVFNEPLDAATVDGTTVLLVPSDGGEPVPARVVLHPTDLTRVFVYAEVHLDVDTAYTVAVTTGVADVAGNTMGAGFSSTFTTSEVGVTPHGGYSMGSSMCRSCHRTHAAAVPGEYGGSLLTHADETDLCYTCHDGSGASTDIQSVFESMASGHVVNDSNVTPGPGLTSRCSSCHGPHFDAESTPGQYRLEINETEVTGDDHTWCQACHDDSASWAASPYPYPSGGVSGTTPQRAPSGYPLSGTYPGGAAYDDTTYNAHNPTTSAGVVWPGSGRSSGDCRNCHAAHGNQAPYDALVATYRPTPDEAAAPSDRRDGTYAELCLTCHDGDGPAGSDILRYVSYDHALTGDDYTGGHRIFTAGGTLPVGAPLPCYDCHNPHGSRGNDGTRPNRALISDEQWSDIDTSTVAGVVAFCTKCHLPWEHVDGSGRPEENTIPAGQLTTIEGLDRRAPANKLSLTDVTPAHGVANAVSPTKSCYACHGDDYGAPSANEGFNVHRPHRGDSCVGCHVDGQDAGDGGPVRRAVVGEFGSASHHGADGPVDDRDCGVCHMEGDAAGSGVAVEYHSNNLIELRDPDTGLSLGGFETFTRDTGSAVLEAWVTVVQEGLCFKCHDSDASRGAGLGGAASPAARVPGGTALRPFMVNSRDVPDVYGAFDPVNGSHHAVRAPGSNPYATATETNGYITTMLPPWNQGGAHDVISCFDCHIDQAGGHGGATRYSLRTDVGTPGAWDYAAQRDLCLRCHSAAVYESSGLGSRFEGHQRTRHLLPSNSNGCRGCHAGLVDNDDLAAPNGAPGSMHGATFVWPAGSKTPGTIAQHYLYGGWLGGWIDGTCYGGSCHHANGKDY